MDLFLGVPGIDVGKASALEGMVGKSGIPGGHRNGVLTTLYGEKGSDVWNKWGAKDPLLHRRAFMANVLDNIRKKGKNKGIFFFTPLFDSFLSKGAGGEQWLNQLKDYRNNFSAMDTAIADIFSDRFIKILKKDEWCVPIQWCSCLLCSYYLWRRTNSNIYTHFFTTPIYTAGFFPGTRRPSCSASTPPWRNTASGALLTANTTTATSSLARWWRTWRLC